MQIFKGVASGKQSFREHSATKWLLEANPRNISASKILRYTVIISKVCVDCFAKPILVLAWHHDPCHNAKIRRQKSQIFADLARSFTMVFKKCVYTCYNKKNVQ